MTRFRTVTVDGFELFYREAGPSDAPVVLLLHGFPSSSRMWQPLIDRLADRYRMVAPDYPGFGHSDAPPADSFSYTFDHIADYIERFTDVLGLDRYTLVVQDYGGPVGMRIAVRRPERLTALIVHNAVCHEDGLGPLWETGEHSGRTVAAARHLTDVFDVEPRRQNGDEAPDAPGKRSFSTQSAGASSGDGC
jgi:pimeloyl-ACP methyl ester carboxylesterase